jgi:Fe-S oxidoreductase
MDKAQEIDATTIRTFLNDRKFEIKTAMAVCAHCSLCAESCFFYHLKDHDPRFMPSHKFIHSIGRLYKKKGRVSRAELEAIQEIVWQRCALCGRCYCPLGIDIAQLIGYARDICRSQNVLPDWEEPWQVRPVRVSPSYPDDGR